MSNLLVRIDQNRMKFSKGQKKIANFIEDHYDKAAYMTALKIAQLVNVSESTVVRFATIIGYDGYPELVKAMQELLKDKLTSLGRIEVTTSRIENKDIVDTVLNQDIEKIKRTIEEVSRTDFNKAVEFIVNAKKIYIFGVKSSSYIASFLGYYLDLMFGNVQLLTDNSKTSNFEKLFRIQNDDVMVCISFPRYSSLAIDSIKFAKNKNAKVISITDSNTSPLVENADSILISKSDIASIVDSLVAPLSLINALIVAIVTKCKNSIKDTFNSLEKVWDQQGIYAIDSIKDDFDE